jgi:hypothetical protein
MNLLEVHFRKDNSASFAAYLVTRPQYVRSWRDQFYAGQLELKRAVGLGMFLTNDDKVKSTGVMTACSACDFI